MRQWTLEERKRQAELIRGWQPWKTVVPKTEKGKAASRRNALKHGARSAEIKITRAILKEARMRLKALKEVMGRSYKY